MKAFPPYSGSSTGAGLRDAARGPRAPAADSGAFPARRIPLFESRGLGGPLAAAILLLASSAAPAAVTNFFQRCFVGQDRMHFEYETVAQEPNSQGLDLEMREPDGATSLIASGSGSLAGQYRLADADDGYYSFAFREIYRVEVAPGEWEQRTNHWVVPLYGGTNFSKSADLQGRLLFSESYDMSGDSNQAVHVTVPTGLSFSVSHLHTTQGCSLFNSGSATLEDSECGQLFTDGDEGILQVRNVRMGSLSMSGVGRHDLEQCEILGWAGIYDNGLCDINQCWFGDHTTVAGATLDTRYSTFAHYVKFSVATTGVATLRNNLFQGTASRQFSSEYAVLAASGGQYTVENNVFQCPLIIEGSEPPEVTIAGNHFVGKEAVLFDKHDHRQNMPDNYWGDRAGPKPEQDLGPGYGAWMSGLGAYCPHATEGMGFKSTGLFGVSGAALPPELDAQPFPSIWVEDMRVGQNTLTELHSSLDTWLIRAGRPILVCYDLRVNQEQVDDLVFRLEANGQEIAPENPGFAVKRDYAPIMITRPEKRTLNFIVPPMATNQLHLTLYMDSTALDGLYEEPGQTHQLMHSEWVDVAPGPARKLRIAVAAFRVNVAGYASISQREAQEVADTLRSHIPAMWPLDPSELDVQLLPMLEWTPSLVRRMGMLLGKYGFGASLITSLSERLAHHNLVSSNKYDFLVAVIPRGALGSETGANAWYGRQTPLVDPSVPLAALHELGHGLGLYTGFGGTGEQYDLPDGPDDKGNVIDHKRGARIMGCTGFNPSYAECPVAATAKKLLHFTSHDDFLAFSGDNGYYDMMAAIVPADRIWCAPSTLESVTKSLNTLLGQKSSYAPAAVSQPSPMDNGFWQRLLFTAAIERDPGDGSYRFVPGTIGCEDADDLPGWGQNYHEFSPAEPTRIFAYDAAGTYLRSDDCRRLDDEPLDATGWAQIFNVESNAVEVVIRRGTNVLFRQMISPGVTNALSGPAPGSALGDSVWLSWQSGFAGPTHVLQRLHDSLFFSADGGATWGVLDGAPASNEMTVATDFLPVSDAIRFKLVSSDGFREAVSEIGNYRMPNRAPRVRILEPRAGDHSVTNVGWRLVGAASDVEDGPIGAGTWESSRDGVLGSSSTLTDIPLSLGTHTLTFRAQDRHAAVGSTSVVVVVGPPDFVDLRVREGDLSLRLPGLDPVYGALTLPQHGVSNRASFVFHNQGVTNPAHVLVYYTPPSGAETLIHSNTLAWSPFESYGFEFGFTPTGQAPLQFRAVLEPDGVADAAPANNTMTWVFTNHPPVAYPAWIAVQPHQTFDVSLAAYDPNGDPLTYELMSWPTQGTLSGSAPNLHYVTTNSFVEDRFTFRVTDGLLPSGEVAVQIAVEGAVDSDGDGLLDLDELDVHHTDPTDPDTDFDGLTDGEEIHTYGTLPLVRDSDGDELVDGQEVHVYGTDPAVVDSDDDGLGDGEEINGYVESFEPGFFTPRWSTSGDVPWSITNADAKGGVRSAIATQLGMNRTASLRHASVTNLAWGNVTFWYRTASTYDNTRFEFLVDDVRQFYQEGEQEYWRQLSCPLAPGVHHFEWVFSKPGSMTDLQDALFLDLVRFTGVGFNTCLPADDDTDDDLLEDGDEVHVYGTDPSRPDTDGDGLDDGDEIHVHGTNPTAKDTDGDGLDDGDEIHVHGTNPTAKDTDGDGLDDGAELGVGGAALNSIASGLPGLQFSSLDWGDYDGDGDLDLALNGGTAGGALTAIFRNEGADTFADIEADLTGCSVGAVAWGDFDRDGDLDLAVMGTDTNYQPVSEIYLQDPGHVFRRTTPFATPVGRGHMAWADYDGDGDLDVFLCGKDGAWNNVSALYRNDGSNVFTAVASGITALSGGGAAWADADGDRDPDLFLTGHDDDWTVKTLFYRNDGGGVFTETGLGLLAIDEGKPVCHDFDGDGDPDLLLSGQDPDYHLATRLYANDGGGSFVMTAADLAARAYGGAAWADYNADGHPDFVLFGQDTNYAPSTMLYRQDAPTNFAAQAHGLVHISQGCAAWGDYDGDGDPDLALTGIDSNGVGVTEIYRNDSAPRTDPTKADTDDDGSPDGDEIYAGTHPNDPQSVLMVFLSRLASGGLLIEWPSVLGRRYALQHCETPLAAFQDMQTGLGATPPRNAVTNDAGASRSGFFRIRVE